MSPEWKPKTIAMIVGSAIIMQQIDSTVITTALPQMAISLHTDPLRLSVAVTAYLLSLAVFVPVSGWAAQRSVFSRSARCSAAFPTMCSSSPRRGCCKVLAAP
jgi:MFS family permease